MNDAKSALRIKKQKHEDFVTPSNENSDGKGASENNDEMNEAAESQNLLSWLSWAGLNHDFEKLLDSSRKS